MRRAKESSTPNPGVTTLVRGDSWRERLKRVIGEVPEWLNGAVSKTVVDLVSTVGSNPTLSAGRKILVAVKAAHYRQPQSFGDMVLTDRGLTTGVVSTPEIAQFALGDLTFKVHTPHYIYSSALVKVLQDKVLSDICSTISTPVLTCPVSSSTSQLSSGVTKLSIQNRLSASWRKPSRIEKSGS